jgi:hypothetical protein
MLKNQDKSIFMIYEGNEAALLLDEMHDLVWQVIDDLQVLCDFPMQAQ